MIKVVYVGESDYVALIQRGDVFFAKLNEDGDCYIVKNKNGEDIYLSRDEVIVYNYETPSQWCKRMQDEARTGEEAMAYYELAQMWMEREKNRDD